MSAVHACVGSISSTGVQRGYSIWQRYTWIYHMSAVHACVGSISSTGVQRGHSIWQR